MTLEDQYLSDDFILDEATKLNSGFASIKAPFYAVCGSRTKNGKLQISYRRYSDGCTGFVNARYVSAKEIEKFLEKNDMPPIAILKKSKSKEQPDIKGICKINQPVSLSKFIEQNKHYLEKEYKREKPKESLKQYEKHHYDDFKQVSKEHKPKTYYGNIDFILKGEPVEIQTASEKIDGHYGLTDLKNLQPSHLFENFAKNPKYPADCQERNYHKDVESQSNVIHVAKNLDPKYLLLDSPTAIEGSPIVNPDGIVLGGNGRTMSMQRAKASYPEKWNLYQTMIKKRISMFGFDKEDLDKFENPVLVRVIKISMDKCSSWSWKLNTGTQKEQSVKSRAVAYSKELDQKDLESLANVLSESQVESFAELKSDKKTVNELIRILRKAGIITETTVSNWLDSPDEFSQNGIMYLETILLSAIVKDKELLSTVKEYSNKILKGIAYFLRMKKLSGKWNLLKYFQEAIKAEHLRREKSLKKVDVIRQTGTFGSEIDRNVEAAWNILDISNIKEFKNVIERITITAENEANSSEGSAIFGGDVEPYEVMNEWYRKREVIKDMVKESSLEDRRKRIFRYSKF